VRSVFVVVVVVLFVVVVVLLLLFSFPVSWSSVDPCPSAWAMPSSTSSKKSHKAFRTTCLKKRYVVFVDSHSFHVAYWTQAKAQLTEALDRFIQERILLAQVVMRRIGWFYGPGRYFEHGCKSH
jgi:hypothetical protein